MDSQVALKDPFPEPRPASAIRSSGCRPSPTPRGRTREIEQKPSARGLSVAGVGSRAQDRLGAKPHSSTGSATNGPFVDAIHMPEFTDPSTEWLAFPPGHRLQHGAGRSGAVAENSQLRRAGSPRCGPSSLLSSSASIRGIRRRRRQEPALRQALSYWSTATRPSTRRGRCAAHAQRHGAVGIPGSNIRR